MECWWWWVGRDITCNTVDRNTHATTHAYAAYLLMQGEGRGVGRRQVALELVEHAHVRAADDEVDGHVQREDEPAVHDCVLGGLE